MNQTSIDHKAYNGRVLMPTPNSGRVLTPRRKHNFPLILEE